MENTDIKKIHDRINKLIRLEEGAKEIGSMEEAANAAAQIQKLLMKYNIDRNQIEPEKQRENIISKDVEIGKEHGYKKTESDWMLVLANHVCVSNMCKLVVTNKNTMAAAGVIRLTIFGEKNTIEQVEYLVLQLVIRIKKMRLEAYKQHAKNGGNDKKNAYFRSYSRACTTEIAIKFQDMGEEVVKSYKGGSQLMVVNNQLLAEAVANKFGHTRSVNRTTKLGSHAGALDGRRDGSNMNIHKGIN
jgi:hypothetical protein